MRIPTPKKIAPGTFSIRLFFNEPLTGKRRSHIVVFEGSQTDANRVALQLALLRRAGVAHEMDQETLAHLAINNIGRGSVVLSRQQIIKT